jgi:hypothetical protein
LADKVGGKVLHGLCDWKVEAILALRTDWGETDQSHRKLAHRGSYLGKVWVSPSTVRRVLAAHGWSCPRVGNGVRVCAQAVPRLGR